MVIRVSIIDQDLQNSLDGDDFLMDLDFNWYYGCLFGTCKKATHDPANLINLIDDDDIKHHEHGSKDPLYEQKKEINLNFEDQKKNDKDLDIAESDGCDASIFRILDENGDGRVSTEEIMRFLEKLDLEIPMEDVESSVKSVSACGYEFITFMEFRDFYRRLIFDDKDENGEFVSNGDYEIDDMAICKAFAVFDQNGDGFISAIELSDVLCRLGLMEGTDVCFCQRMIESVDVNGDGFVDLQEFRHLITRSCSLLSSNLLC